MEEENLLKKDKQGRFPNEDERYRTYIFVLYKDSEVYDYEEVLNTIKGDLKYYAFIEHKAEKNETKDHTHVIVHFPNGRYPGAFSKSIGIPSHYLQIPLSIRGCMRYLTHIDYPEKIQYDLQFVNVSKSYMKSFYNAFDDEKIDIDILNDIYQFIDDNKEKSPIQLEKELSLYVCSASYNRIFRMYYNTIVKYIQDKV